MKFFVMVALLWCVLGLSRDVMAAEPGSGAEAGPPASTDAVYTLFFPTPKDQLRGMDTDRPNKTNTPHTIDAGHYQLELGAVDGTFFRDRSRGADTQINTIGVGQLNLRVGVLKNMELNISVVAADFLRVHDYATGSMSHDTTFGDTVVGGKLNLWGDEGSDKVWATALAIQPAVKIPTAAASIGNTHPEASVGLPFLLNLPAGFHLALQSTLSWERSFNNAGYVAGWSNSVSVDHVVLEKLDVYIEYWSHVTSEKHVEAAQTVDVGGSYPVTDNVSVDTGFNFGLNQASVDVEWLCGVSVRF